MAAHPFGDDLARLDRHYSRLLEERGDTPEGVQWTDRETQERRMAILTEISADLTSAKVLDFGCGTGHLLAVMRNRLKFAGEYVGYDLSRRMIATARSKFRRARFECRDILADGVPEDFDYVLMNGVFNNPVTDNWNLMTAILRRLFPHVLKGLAFNALSTYVDRFDPDLSYISPERVFRFCKEELSPCVTLRHDYVIRPGIVPFEFSTYVYATQIPPRKELKLEGAVGWPGIEENAD